MAAHPPRPRPPRRAGRVPRPRAGRAERRAGRRRRRTTTALTVVRSAARGRADPTRAAEEPWVGRSVLPRSRTTRCCAARAASSTTSSRSPDPAMRRSSAHSSPTRGSRSTPPRRSRTPASSESSRARTWRRCRARSPAGSRPACRSTRPRSTRCATSASRSPSSSPATATWPRTRRSSSRSTTTPSTRCSTRSRRRPSARPRPSFAYGDVGAALARAPTSSCGRRFTFPRFTCTPVECYAVVADWDATAGRLTAWANFQGPFTLHGVAAAALGLRGDRLRLLTPPDSGGSFGIKSSVFAYVVLIGPRRAPPRRARQLGRGPARAPRGERRLDRAHDGGRGRVHGRRRAGRPPLRRDRGRRRVRPRAGAGDAVPDARLALGRLPGAERRHPQPGRAHEHDPVGAEPGLRRAAALPRARADDGDRRAAARPRPRRARPPQPRARRRDALPHALRGALRLGRLRGAASTRRSSSPATTALRARARRARAEGRLAGIGLACIVEPSISNMGYITLAQTAEERAALAAEVGQRRGRHRSRSTRSAGSRCASPRRRRARATAPSARRSSRTCSAATRPTSP